MPDYKFSINSNEYLPLRDVVFNTLRDAILTGKLVPGERLMENQLADKLGVSRTPIREALRMLELENLVELVPRKGAQVLDMNEKDVINILDLRAALESLGVKLACRKMTKEQIEELKSIEQEFEDAYDKEDLERSVEADENFHDLIFKSTENDKLIQIINNLRIQLYRYRINHLKYAKANARVQEHHHSIINSIEERDADKAEQAAVEHVKYQTEFILREIRTKEDFK